MFKVFVEDRDQLIEVMFKLRGWEVVNKADQAELIVFGGGSDVSPMLYEQRKYSTTHTDPIRDEYNSQLFHTYVGKVPLVGICRGAQFLCVMQGGELVQHISGHGNTHDAQDPATGEVIEVTSSHHQMMVPEPKAEIVLTADGLAKVSGEQALQEFYNDVPVEDVEAILYEEDRIFCYQPHPEWVDKGHPCQDFFFDFVEDLMYKD